MVVPMFQCYSLNSSHPLLLQLSSRVLPLHLCIYSVQLSSFHWLSGVWLYATPWTTARQISLSITNSGSLPKLMSIELVMPSNHLIPCHPLLLPLIFPNIRVFSNESALRITWPKYWSFSFNISPSHPGLISFRMDWLDLLQFKGLSRVFSNTTVQKHQFCAQLLFIVRLLHSYMTTRKTIALTRQTFVDKGMSLLF